MTNHEKYKEAFSVLHTSTDFSLEVKKMEHMKKQHHVKRLVASIAACTALVGSATAAYAADLGGIQRTLQVWIHGDQTQVTMELDGNGHYQMDYVDAAGEHKTQGGGGVALGPDGSERPLTEEELLEELNAPSVEYEENGRVYVYWLDQKVEITDKFENGVCYVKLVNGDDVRYMTVKDGVGWSTSPTKFLAP